eukprot:CAMPEP_0176063046 /NCGR_PEP_ID=MMETSP0120_2-20121206/31441_1 /TAXON_ID=160619 /ORGANISM="Kryptoperidinium foliaceum, Strain CCMP 1326" /LENGTH=351 /DNA_ID=CAMNT_0017396615 /DNA_START=62 /DNA_END=1117 /DNA_ORIENTATION=-
MTGTPQTQDVEVGGAFPTATTVICPTPAQDTGKQDAGKGTCVKAGGVCVPAEAAKELLALTAESAMEEEVLESENVKLMRALAAEAIGTGMIVLVGCGSVCSSLSGAYSGIWQVAIVWGIGVALAIYSTADISGAHLNPAITLAFQLVRPEAHGMTPKKSALYVVAQFVGAIACAAINLAIYSDTIEAFERNNNITRGDKMSILSASAFGEYFPNPGLTKAQGGSHYAVEDVSVAKAFFVEAWGTFFLAFIIFGLTNRYNKVGLGAGVPFMIGMTVSINLALWAPITQAGWNPARDFGPRLVAAMGGWGKVAIPGPRNGFWIYIVAPCVGGPLGAALAEFLLWRRYPKKAQ